MKKPFIRKIIISLISFIALTALVLTIGTYYIYKHLPSILADRFDRYIYYSELKIDLIKARITVKDLRFGLKEDDVFLTADSIDGSFDILALIQKRELRVLSFSCTNPSLRVTETETGSFVLPEFFKTQVSSGSFNSLIKNFFVEDINLTGGRVFSDKGLDIIDNLSLTIPGVYSGNLEVAPKISGSLLGNSFEIDGRTTADDDGFSINFLVDLSRFRLLDIYRLFNLNFRYRITAGTVSGNLSINYKTRKNYSNWIISGDLRLSNLGIFDGNKNSVLARELNARVDNLSVNIKERDINIGNIIINSGTLFYEYQEATQQNLYTGYGYGVSDISINNLWLNFKDSISGYSTIIVIKDSSVSGFNFPDSSELKFSIDCRSDNIDRLVLEGVYDKNRKYLELKSLNIDRCNTDGFIMLQDRFPVINRGVISLTDGALTITDDEYLFGGRLRCNDLEFKTSSSPAIIKTIEADIRSLENNGINIGSMMIDSFRTGDNAAEGLSFELPISQNGYSFGFIFSDIKKEIIIDQMLVITDVSSKNVTGGNVFNFTCNSIEADIKGSISLMNGLKLNLITDISLYQPILRVNDEMVFRSEGISASVKRLNMFPVDVFIDNLTVTTPLLNSSIKSDNRFVVCGFLEPFNNEARLPSIDNKITVNEVVFSDGIINITDRSMVPQAVYTIERISGNIRNLPSEVNSNGTISLNGVFEGVSTVNLSGNIRPGNSKIDIQIKDLIAVELNRYIQKYTGNRITGGSCDISSVADISNGGFSVNSAITLKDLSAVRVTGNINLDQLLRNVRDPRGFIRLDIDVNGTNGGVSVDYKKSFFDLFVNALSNTTGVSAGNAGYTKKNFYDMIIFPAGSDKLLNTDGIFSSRVLSEFDSQDSLIIIESYFDQAIDMAGLKDSVFNELYGRYSVAVTDERSRLLDIYRHLNLDFDYSQLDNNQLRLRIVNNITPDHSDVASFVNRRSAFIKEIIIEFFSINENRIIIRTDHDIYRNINLSNISHNLCIVTPAEKK